MPQGPEPIRIVTPQEREDVSNTEFNVRIHTAHEPSGRRRTVNLQAIVEATTPATAAALAIVHLMQTLHDEGKDPVPGTMYRITMRQSGTEDNWSETIEYAPTGAAKPLQGKRTAEGQATYKQRAEHEAGSNRAPRIRRDAPENESTSDWGQPGRPLDQPTTSEPAYFVKLLSQQTETTDALPLEAEAVVKGKSALDAAETAVEDFRGNMPGLISRQSRRTTYQVDVVREADEDLPYEGWHIEVTYDTKKGLVGRHGQPKSATIH